MADKGTCRACHKDIIWVKGKNGKPSPFDAQPTVVLIADSENTLMGPEFRKAHLNHFITCPQADQFRRKEQ